MSGSEPRPMARIGGSVIEAGLLIVVILTALYFNPDTQHTFEPDKAALLRSVVLIAGLAWAIRWRMEDGKGKMEVHSPSSILHPPFYVLSVLVFFAAYCISTAISVLPRLSWWGTYERGQGLYTVLGYLGLFWLSRRILRDPHRRQRLVDTILLVSLPISLYALLQRFGLDPMTFDTGGTGVTERAISTLGNPIFLGAYLIMVIPLTMMRIYQAWQQSTERAAPNLRLAGLYLVLLGVQLGALLSTQSRGPTLGLIGGLVFGGLVWAAHLRARRLIASVGVLAACTLILVSQLPALMPGPNTTPLGRLGQLADLSSRTGRQRLLAWQATVDLVASEPTRMWIGYGPGTLRDIIGPHMPAEIASLKPDEDFDRAHNAILDLWATNGLIGVLAYLAVIIALFYYGLQIVGLISRTGDGRLFLALALAGVLLGGLVPWTVVGRHWAGVGLSLGLLSGVGAYVVERGLRGEGRRSRLSNDELLAIALLAAISGYLVETLVGIATVTTQTLFWVYVALIASLIAPPHERESSARAGGSALPPRPSTPLPPSTVWGLLTGITLAMFGFSVLTAGGARGGMAWGVVVSATLLFGAWLLSNRRPEFNVVAYLGVSAGAVLSLLLLIWLPWPPTDSSHPTVAVYLYIGFAVLALAANLAGVDDSVAAMPQVSWRRLALYTSLGIVVLVTVWFTNVNPIRADVFYKQGLGLAGAGRLQEAVDAFSASVALRPWEDRYESGLGAVYAQMAQTATEPAQQQEWLSQAENHLQEAHRLDPYRADHLRNLGLLYRIWAELGSSGEREARYTQALDFYRQAAARNPVGVRIQTELADMYGRLGRWEEAAEHYRQSISLNSGFVEAHLGLGDAYLHLGDYEPAAQAYQNALELDDAQALGVKEQAAQQDPDNPIPHQSLAILYAELGRVDAARTEAETAQQLLKNDDALWDRFLSTLN